MRRLKILMIGLFFVLSLVLLLPINTVSANQYGVTVGAVVEDTGSALLYIPNGTYHVYVSIDADLGSYGSAICESDIFSVSIGYTYTTYTFESALTVNESGTYNFTATVYASISSGYYANFGIVFTDLDVATLVKTSVIGSAPFNLEVMLLGLMSFSVVFAFMRRKQNRN